MRILTVVKDLGYRGTQRTAEEFSIEYANRGFDVAVLAYAEGGVRESRLRQNGVRVYIGTKQVFPAKKFLANVIHFHRQGLPNRIESRLLKELKTSKNRIMETNVFGRYDPSREARLIDVHLQLTHWNMRRWKRWTPRKAKLAAAILPNPVDTETFFREKPQLIRNHRVNSMGIPQGAFLCGRIGNWDPMAFYAFEALLSHNSQAYLACVMDHPDVRQVVHDLPRHVRRRIIQLPKINSDGELRLFYSSLDCLIHASTIGETFGLVVAEAMSCGCPVVTAAVPHKGNSQAEIVRHNDGGIVAASLRELPNALVYLHENPSLLRVFSDNARELIRSRYGKVEVVSKALLIADLALKATNDVDLIRRLEEAPEIETAANNDEIRRAEANIFGQRSRVEWMMMHLISSPYVYNLYRLLKPR